MYPKFSGFTRPILIAGPCAAESEVQLWETAKALKAGGDVLLFRCGSWKMRSRPDGFAGMGEASLPVLQRIRTELGLPVCVEIATPDQAAALLKHDIRCCWLGARTTVNPQQVAEIAESLRGTDMSVMVKNPVAPDLKLWEGAFERLLQAGLTDLAAVHRGFSTSDAAPYRNRPLWHVAIEFKRRHPEWAMIGDPSHISGCRQLLPEVSQQALNLDFDGLMIEVHPSPDYALSDAAQQITPDEFTRLLSGLRFPTVPAADGSLQRYRAELDELDAEILALFARRMHVSREIAHVKAEKGLPLLQMERWREVLADAVRQGENLGLDARFVESLMQLVHAASLDEQENVLRHPAGASSEEDVKTQSDSVSGEQKER